MGQYISCTFDTSANSELTEILMAELAELPFETFEDEENKLTGYIRSDAFSEQHILSILDEFKERGIPIPWTKETYEPQNWNENWEKNFEPIFINEDCIVRAPFHTLDKAYQYDLIIQPKMSFGTGHHETTRLMIKHILEIDFSDKNVLDMGCGTSVLAILSGKLGANEILAVDNNEWAYENSLENIAVNKISNLRVLLGDEGCLLGKNFDVILANINRNIILEHIPIYADCLPQNGLLVTSGFFQDDLMQIQAKAEDCGFNVLSVLTENNWVSVKFVKK